MRTIWLGVIVVALGAATSGHAQDSMMQKLMLPSRNPKTEPWASEYAPAVTTAPQPGQSAAAIAAPDAGPILPDAPIIVPAAPPSGTSVVRQVGAVEEAAPPSGSAKLLFTVPPDPAPTPAMGSDRISPALPPVVHDARPSRAVAVNAAAKEKCDQVQYVLHRLRTWATFRELKGCCCTKATCCHIPPIYLYTVHDCVEGHQGHELPCCAHETGPFRALFVGDKDSLAESRQHPVKHP
jgi:hypothetical protein